MIYLNIVDILDKFGVTLEKLFGKKINKKLRSENSSKIQRSRLQKNKFKKYFSIILTVAQRGAIVGFSAASLNHSVIARQLGCSRATVIRLIDRHAETQGCEA